MAEETTVEEVKEEEAVETSEEDSKKKGKSKSKTKKANVDVNKIAGQAKDGIGNAKNFLTKFFSEDTGRGKLVLTILYVVQAILAFQAGFVFFLLSLVIAAIGFIGLGAVVPQEDKKEESAEE